MFDDKVADLRTDDSFSYRHQKEHHLSQYELPGSLRLEMLGVGMVSQFPIDPMHSVDLGVMKRILDRIVKHKKYVVGAPKKNDQLKCMNSDFVSYATHTPSEFQRKPRSLFTCSNFKATEFRQILLYTGMVLFKDYLSPELYNLL